MITHIRILSRIDELKQSLEVLLVGIFDGDPGGFFQRNKLMERKGALMDSNGECASKVEPSSN